MMRNIDALSTIISNVGDSTLSIINLLNLCEVRKIFLKKCFGPHHVVGDFCNKYLYITNSYNCTVSKYDLILDMIIDTVYVGSHPCHLVLNKRNGLLYVSNEDSNSISVVDAKTMAIQAQNEWTKHCFPMGQSQNI